MDVTDCYDLCVFESGNLLSCANLTNLLTHIAICAGFQITVFFLCQQQPGYHDFSQDDDWDDRV
jgi:hypothetical protein